MDVKARLSELARIKGAATPVVSVYLNTRWADEHQRERVRVFLKNEIRKVRRGEANNGIDSDLDWVEGEGEALIAQARFPEAHGVALFACQSLGLREIIPVRVPFEDAFVVADAPFLRPLAEASDRILSVLVVFVDGESARLIPLNAEGGGAEVTLEAEVPGRHSRGGWAQLAQSRYHRHIQDHRGRHFEAVAKALVQLTRGNGVERIVMAGEPRTIAAFRAHLPHRVDDRVGGSVPGARHEPAGALLRRAAELLASVKEGEEAGAVDAVLTEAAKSRRAVAGLEETLEAVSRGAVHRLYMLKGFGEPGRACGECGALQRGDSPTCRLCGNATRATELGEALVDRVIATDGKVELIKIHEGLARVGGVAALLRFPL